MDSEEKGGRRRYEPPKIYELEVDMTQAMGQSQCTTGARAQGDCSNGSQAGKGCANGNHAGVTCNLGNKAIL